MNHKLIIDRVEGEMAVLITEDGTHTINWPKNMLPPDSKEGDVVNFNIQDEEELGKDKRDIAKEILNEILNKDDIDESVSG